MSRQQLRKLALWITLVVGAASIVLAVSTVFTEPFNSGHGWTFVVVTNAPGEYTQNNNVTTDGNPANSVSATIVGNNNNPTGYFKKTFTWEQLGVPVGDTVASVDGKWDDKAVGGACDSSARMGMQIFNSGDTAEITASAVEPLLNVSADTAAWTNHNPVGTINVNSGSTASGTTVTLRFNINPHKGNGSGSCELRGDNYSLTIVSASRHQVITSELKLPETLDAPAESAASAIVAPTASQLTVGVNQ